MVAERALPDVADLHLGGQCRAGAMGSVPHHRVRDLDGEQARAASMLVTDLGRHEPGRRLPLAGQLRDAAVQPQARWHGETERFRRFQARWVCNTPPSFTALAKMMSTTDLTANYSNIKAKTLVIGAKHDVQRPATVAQQVAKAIDGATYVEADTGHFMNVKTPELFAEMVGKFFKG